VTVTLPNAIACGQLEFNVLSGCNREGDGSKRKEFAVARSNGWAGRDGLIDVVVAGWKRRAELTASICADRQNVGTVNALKNHLGPWKRAKNAGSDITGDETPRRKLT
jgi:hypothetical protein